jgi:hypothetical protein
VGGAGLPLISIPRALKMTEVDVIQSLLNEDKRAHRVSMGTLTSFLQHEFVRRCPTGWQARAEARLLPKSLEDLLGYSARADVLLESLRNRSRIWIEFEVSRADPVANHTKFATSHLFQPQSSIDRFLAMVSPHVTRGRRNLASNTIALMRQVGMKAYQTVLLPYMAPADVKRINYLSRVALFAQNLDVDREIERALAVVEPAMSTTNYDIHLVGDLLGVMLSVRRWNDDVSTEVGKRMWGRRTVTYFVFELESGLFAPSKFCAYSAVPTRSPLGEATQGAAALGAMTIAIYTAVNDGSHLLDGHRAQMHLTRGLGMIVAHLGDVADLDVAFDEWMQRHEEDISIHPSGPLFLMSPDWFS